jgi:hypothetical protein
VCFHGNMAQRKKKVSKAVSRRSKGTDWWEAFFQEYTRTRSMRAAAELVGVSASVVYQTKKNDTEFAARLKDTWVERTFELEDSAMSRAINGWDEPVYYMGEEVGTKRVFSTALTIFMLKANHPDKYHLERHVADTTAEEQAHQMRAFLQATSAERMITVEVKDE